MRALAVAALSLFAGCAGSIHYEWGRYEPDLAERAESSDPRAHLDQHIADLEGLIARADDHHRPVPPGVRAHLGYLYALHGDVGQAKRWIAAEAEAFPESKVMVDFMLARIDGRAPLPPEPELTPPPEPEAPAPAPVTYKGGNS